MTAPTSIRRPTRPRAHTSRLRLVVRGVVQGVGFRPHVARLAADLGLAGHCRNDATSVLIEVEGPPAALAEFRARLEAEAPPLARILSIEFAEFAGTGEDGFTITDSAPSGDGRARTMVPPDTAVCADCLAELRDRHDRRFGHPFITCTNCGPRFTITRDLPYDRATTTMEPFALCARCAVEYADPRDRRYHAQPIGCHDCGPTVWFDDGTANLRRRTDAIDSARAVLRDGGIIAVKGLGGYHLACDARSDAAVAELRLRKHRPHRPFAVMAADLVTARSIVDIPAAARAALLGAERPIIILPRAAGADLSDDVAPGLDELGVMLPYTPLHHLLFDGGPQLLVMTSGNLAGEPLCYLDHDAVDRLRPIADALLGNDRPIVVPCEDSVFAWSDADGLVPVRRSRGFAPLPLLDDGMPTDAIVLAAGSELKNTFALVRDGSVFLSAHVGDLGSLESRRAYQSAVDQALRFHRRSPGLVVSDLHPGYTSREWAMRFAEELGVELYEVQHHHAHLASLAVEHQRMHEPILGLVFDGTGYGCDATIWGGEFLLLGDGGLSCERLGQLAMVPLPGGDAGVRNPVRTAAAAMSVAGIPLDGSPVGDELTETERELIPALMSGSTGWVATSSVGRLFDVASSMLGIRHRISYEAQAAVELEVVAARWARSRPEPARSRTPVAEAGTVLEHLPLLRALDAGVRAGTEVGELAWAFHAGLAERAVASATSIALGAGVSTVGLSGGVFNNRLLLALIRRGLEDNGFGVLTHRLVPTNDGGLALGQAGIGARVRRSTSPAATEVSR